MKFTKNVFHCILYFIFFNILFILCAQIFLNYNSLYPVCDSDQDKALPDDKWMLRTVGLMQWKIYSLFVLIN